MNTKHTPTPWRVNHLMASGHGVSIDTPKGGTAYLGTDNMKFERGEIEANADFIVRAVNNHESLVEALSEILDWWAEWHCSDDPTSVADPNMEKATLALFNATGKEPNAT